MPWNDQSTKVTGQQIDANRRNPTGGFIERHLIIHTSLTIVFQATTRVRQGALDHYGIRNIRACMAGYTMTLIKQPTYALGYLLGFQHTHGRLARGVIYRRTGFHSVSLRRSRLYI